MHDHQANTIRWTAHPARERPGRAAIGAAIIALLGAAVWLSFGWEWSVASAVILLLSLNRFFLPSRFEMDEERIIARYPMRKKILHWRDVRRFVYDDDGGFLSTRSRRSLLDPSSGMHVLFGGEETQRGRIIERIQERVSHDAERRATDDAGGANLRVAHDDGGATLRVAQSDGAVAHDAERRATMHAGGKHVAID